MARTRQRTLLFAAIVALCVGCDHATKEVASRALAPGSGVSLLGDALRLDLVRNPGAFLSFGSFLPAEVRHVLLLGLVPAGLAAFCLLAIASGFASGASLVGLGLLAGGGIANWLDRLTHGGMVTDFVSFGLGPLRTGIFNVADICIVAGVGWLLAAELGRPGRRGRGSDPGPGAGALDVEGDA